MKEKFALVTGASSGIGKAIAIELAKRQVNLILVALPETGLPATASQISGEYQVEVKYCELDLTSDTAAHYLHQWCHQQNVKINILVNNAGMGTLGSFEHTAIPELETMLKLNNQALVMLAYYFIPDLRRNGPANILNVGSLASLMNIPGKAVYSASKSFIYSFSLSLRMELRPYRISVSCLCPGGTITSSRVIKNASQVRFAGKRMQQMPDEVAREAIRKMYKGKKLIIPGWKNKFLYSLWACLPQRLVDLILLALFYQKKFNNLDQAKTAVALNALVAS